MLWYWLTVLYPVQLVRCHVPSGTLIHFAFVALVFPRRLVCAKVNSMSPPFCEGAYSLDKKLLS